MSKKNKAKKSGGLTQKQKSWLYTGIFLAVALVFFIVNNSGKDEGQGPYPPNYVKKSTAMLDLSEYKGKVVLLDFWATWCPPCRKGIPDLVELKKEFGDDGLEIIGISLDAITRGGQTANDVIPFMNDFNINYPVVKGDQNVINAYGGIRSIPTSFVIDKEGNIISQHVGLIPKSQYVEEIKAAFNGSKGDKGVAANFSLPVIK